MSIGRGNNAEFSQAAIFYLTTCGAVCTTFAWCSFWAYRAANYTRTTPEHVCEGVVARESLSETTSMADVGGHVDDKDSREDFVAKADDRPR